MIYTVILKLIGGVYIYCNYYKNVIQMLYSLTMTAAVSGLQPRLFLRLSTYRASHSKLGTETPMAKGDRAPRAGTLLGRLKSDLGPTSDQLLCQNIYKNAVYIKDIRISIQYILYVCLLYVSVFS